MAGVDELSELKSRLKICFTILNHYSWLLDSYVLDFFTQNHMEKLPKSWKEQVKRTPLEEFYFLMNPLSETQTIWPLSMLSLRVLTWFLTLQREAKRTEDIRLILSNKVDSAIISELHKIKSVCFDHPKLRNLFLKHVKPKKRYEIFKMAKTTAEIANKLNVNYIIDVGSGLGHLSRIMAYGFGLNVCSIETQAQLTAQAEKMDYEFENTASKHLPQFEANNLKTKKPVHVNQTIKFDLTPNELVMIVKKAFLVPDGNDKFGIVGLHPCGDLAAVLLKLYAQCSEAKFINLVGCCYHKLSTSGDAQHDPGFPLTEFSTTISYEARALACHAIESYRERLLTKSHDHLKVHCYRAALEGLIDKNWPRFKKHPLGNAKPGPELSFKAYCRSALMKLNVSVPEEDFESEETLQNLSKWEDVVKFYSLRLMLAPLIETAILLDRKIFLLQKGFQCRIIAAFDPEISPRNQLLISEKIN